MISLTEAQQHVLERCAPPEARTLELVDAHGLVLAEDIVSREAVPPFANTAMDGFAVRAADTIGASDESPVRLRIIETLAAGHATDREVAEGEAIRIMTGAPMPPGADAVVMVERTQTIGDYQDQGSVDVFVTVEPGQHVRAAGDDVQVGQPVLAAGEVITAGHLGVLASIGVTEVLAHPRPRVGVFSTGDELVQDGAPLRPGQIRDSNRITLLAMVRDAGFEGVDLGCLRDNRADITGGIAAGAERCDALLTSGGVSMGDFDYVKVVLNELGDMRWMQIAIKPAKPFAFGVLAQRTGAMAVPVPVFGLPGNPVSSMISFELLARPALRKMAGHPEGDWFRTPLVAVLDEPLSRRPDGKLHLARVRLRYDHETATYRARSAGAQGSHHLTAMAAANAIALLPDGDTLPAGAPVDVLKMGTSP